MHRQSSVMDTALIGDSGIRLSVVRIHIICLCQKDVVAAALRLAVFVVVMAAAAAVVGWRWRCW